MKYPIAIHKDKDSDYGVVAPDLPGCTSAGVTIDEALTMAREAITGHLQVMAEEGYEIPKPKPIEVHKENSDYQDAALWSVVDVDMSNLPGRSRRINISINERTLDVLDQYARQAHESRSGVIQRVVRDYLKLKKEIASF